MKAVWSLFSFRKSSNQLVGCLHVRHPFRTLGVFVNFVCMVSRNASSYSVGPQCNFVAKEDLVGALSLDVTGLLALVASSLTGGLGWAVAGEMANLATVVALLTLGAVTYAG